MSTFDEWSEAGVRDDIERAFSRGFKAGQQSCATGPFVDGPPPEQEGLEVLCEWREGGYLAGCMQHDTKADGAPWDGWALLGIDNDIVLWPDKLKWVVRHAIIQPKEQP